MAQIVEEREAEIALANVVVGRDPDDMRLFGTKATMQIGRHLVGTGDNAHTTTPFLLDALRPHVILVTGKRGQGKCLVPGTPVLLANGEERTIDALFAQVKQPDPEKDEELIECKGIHVVSIDEKLNMVSDAVSHVYKRRISEKMIAIKTKGGKEIVCTKEHPLLSIEDDIIWRASDELQLKAAVGTCMSSVSSSRGQLMKHFILSWDEVAEIREIDYSGNVYDLTVPKFHNFIANNIVCHNSYTMGIVAEELKSLPADVRRNLCGVIIDTQGIFWSMKQPNDRQPDVLERWNMIPKALDIKLYVPEMQKEIFERSGVPYDDFFSISPSDLSVWEWLGLFNADPSSKLGILLQKTLSGLAGKNYGLTDIASSIPSMDGFENEALYLQNLFSSAAAWGVFSRKKMPNLLESEKISVVDISLTPPNVRSLLVSMICNDLLEKRVVARRKEDLTGEKTPLCWIFIDESHNFVPASEKTLAADILLKIAKEGRQPGLTLVLASQQPEKLHEDILAQTDLLISHRLTSKGDIESLKKIMQTYVAFPIEKYMAELPRKKGAALVLDDNSERLYSVLMRPRKSAHAGESPVAI
ncbi:MAG: hypothetical protein HYW25_04435 [Candidatus Aenigmarchaeota archaeon]|nr:hypothetical protein [Candidatus Aenigmarchaeota archaeon]